MAEAENRKSKIEKRLRVPLRYLCAPLRLNLRKAVPRLRDRILKLE